MNQNERKISCGNNLTLSGQINAKYSYSTAVGLFNTVVNIILLIIVNRIAKKAADVSFV